MGATSKHLIEQQIPYHIRESSPLFTKFLQYYYEFIEQSEINEFIQDIRSINDIDEVDVVFIKQFYEEFKRLPRNIATNERFVAKHIYDLYKTKGSERSIKLLFKIVYGDDINIRYPSESILRASDGRWVQSKFVTIQFDATIPSQLVVPTGARLLFNNSFGSYEIDVTAVEFITTSKLRVYFKSTSSVNVVADQEITLIDANDLSLVGIVTTEFSKLSIIDGGSGWKRGQTIVVPGTFKDTIARVSLVGAAGSIVELDVIEYGWTHNTNQTLIITGAYSATLGFVTSRLTTTRGYYESDAGQISNSEVKLQDNEFYQQYSYVIDTNVGIETFKDIIGIVHPAGTRYFSQLIKTANIDVSSYITGQYAQSAGTMYLQDVADTDDSNIKFITGNLADTPVIVETITNKTLSTSRSDTATISDAPAKSFITSRSEILSTPTDSSTLAYTKVETETIVTSEDITGVSIASNLVDTVAAPVDLISNNLTRGASDSQAVADSTPSKTIVSTVNETVTVSDTRTLSATAVTADSVTVTDQNTVTATLGLSDTATITEDATEAFVVSLVDSPAITDSITSKVMSSDIYDIATLGDTRTLSATAVASDSVTVTDQNSNGPSITLSDNNVTSTDVITNIGPSRDLSDSQAVADGITSKTSSVVLNDTAVTGESISVAGNIIITLDDAPSIVDAPANTYVLNLSDSTPVTDALSISQTKYNTDTVTPTDGTPVTTFVVYQSEDYFSEVYVASETIINIT
jgi:hypothetical protein